MEAEVIGTGSKVVVKLTGKLNFRGHKTFNDACRPLLQQPDVVTVDVDLSDVDYIDSSGLGLLMLLNEKAQAVDKEIVLCNPQASVLQILNVANMGQLFNIASTN